VDTTRHSRAVPISFSDFTELPSSVDLHHRFAVIRTRASRLTMYDNEREEEQNWAKPPV